MRFNLVYYYDNTNQSWKCVAPLISAQRNLYYESVAFIFLLHFNKVLWREGVGFDQRSHFNTITQSNQFLLSIFFFRIPKTRITNASLISSFSRTASTKNPLFTNLWQSHSLNAFTPLSLSFTLLLPLPLFLFL